MLLKCANSGKYISQSDGKLTSVKESTEGSHWVPRVSPKGGLILVNAVSGTVIDLTGGNAAAALLFSCTSIILPPLKHGILFRLRLLMTAITLW